MGKPQPSKENCFNSSSPSKILWSILSQAQSKVIISIRALKAEKKGIGRKLSIRTTRRKEWMQNEGFSFCKYEKSDNTYSFRKLGRRKCYLCQLENQSPPIAPKSILDHSSSAPTAPELDIREPVSKYLPITRSQPPLPPRRSTSLPHYKILKRLKCLQLHPSPGHALTTFRFQVEDGSTWQFLVNRILSPKNDNRRNGIRDPIWKTILRAAHKEPGIRHLTLAIGHLSLSLPSPSPNLIPFHLLGLARYHPSTLYSRNQSPVPDREIYESAFLTLYLLTNLCILMKKVKIARYYHRIAFRVLKNVLRTFDDDDDDGEAGEGTKLPGCMRDVARAFGRLVHVD